MTALRRRMLEDMQVRNLSAGTQQVYLQHIWLYPGFPTNEMP